MFLGSLSKAISPTLQRVVEQSETDVSEVLAAHAFRYPVLQQKWMVEVNEPRRFNILEEFILRAGAELTDPNPTESELATVLGLDPIFVSSTVEMLRGLRVLKELPNRTIQLTEEGRLSFEQGSVPCPPRREFIVSCGDFLLGRLEYRKDFTDLEEIDLPDLYESINFSAKVPSPCDLDLAGFRQSLIQAGNTLHSQEQGRVVSFFQPDGAPRQGWRSITFLVLLDLVEGGIKLQAWVGSNLSIPATEWLVARSEEDPGLVSRLLQVDDEEVLRAQEVARDYVNAEVEKRRSHYQEVVVAKLAEKAVMGSEVVSVAGDTIRIVRDGEIRQVFIDCITEAKHEIILFSPWISDYVVDKEFLKYFRDAAERGVFVVIGHGITSSPEREDRPVPQSVIEAFHGIHTPEGEPAVVVLWLGNSHAKEIVVDQVRHLSGSFNWLSYRGDYLPRGETVYDVTSPNEVEASRAYYAERFRTRAVDTFVESKGQKDWGGISRSLAVLVAIGAVEESWQCVSELGDPEALWTWLRLMIQRWRGGSAIEGEIRLVAEAFGLLAREIEEEGIPENQGMILARLAGLAVLDAAEVASVLLAGIRLFGTLGWADQSEDSLRQYVVQVAQKSRRGKADSKPKKGKGSKKKR
jgi:hypothetical protein